jgi:hypothetical protein
MGMGGSMPFDPAEQDRLTQARLDRERVYQKQDRENQKLARMEEERLRLSLERAFREQEQEELEQEQEELKAREESAIQESESQQASASMAMGKVFADRPSVQIPSRGS